jgi:hypothetical protein
MGLENTSGLGVRAWYGAVPIATDGKLSNKYGGEKSSTGLIKEVEYIFDWNDLPTAPGTVNLDMEYIYPKGSTILESIIQVITAMTGTSGTMTIGLERADGTDMDVDGFHTAAQLVQASLTAGNSLKGTGALIGTTSDATYDGRLIVINGGTVTGGKYRLVVRYLPPVLGAGPEDNRSD